MDTGYIVFDPSDDWHASRCGTEADLVLCLSNVFGKRPFPTVLEYEIDGYCRDRTDEMREKYARQPDPEEYPETDWMKAHTAALRRAGAFGRH